MTILHAVRGFSSAEGGCVCPIYPELDSDGRGTSCDEADLCYCRIRSEVVADLINDKLKEMRGE